MPNARTFRDALRAHFVFGPAEERHYFRNRHSMCKRIAQEKEVGSCLQRL
jgi:hypothetical protein